MEWVFLVLVGVGVVGWLGVRKLRAEGGARKALPAPQRTLMTLQVNDIVSHFGTDYLVENSLVYDDEGDEWFAHRLVDGDDVVWLSVEQDDSLEVAFYREITDLPLSAPPPKELTYEGVRYEQEEWGKATVTRKTVDGSKKLGTCTYFEYEGPAGELLSVTQWGDGELEASVGKPVKAIELEILPGDLVTE